MATPQAIHHELRTAQNSASYLLPMLRSMRDKNADLRLLDVGAGSGTISVTLAKEMPQGHVTATDLNKNILERAQTIATAHGVTNISFQQADAYQLPFPDASFDVTHCHQVLAHLQQPWNVLREMMRVTKPGGVVAVREGDLTSECVWPELAGMAKFHKLAGDLIQLRGGCITAGRQLLSWALKAGALRSQVDASLGTWHYTTADEKGVWGMSDVNSKVPSFVLVYCDMRNCC